MFLRSMFQLLVTAYVVSSALILSTLMMEAINSSETSVLSRPAQCHVPRNGILHSYRREQSGF
jgi:hypothetical protein